MRQTWFPRFLFKGTAAVLLLAPLNAHAQVPDYFEQQQMWSMFQSVSCGNVECYCVQESSLYVDQDTVFEGHIYQRIGSRGIHYEGAIGMPDPMNPCNTQVQQFDGTFAYLRQSNDSVFMFNTDSQAEVLFASYNLQVGDTLYPNNGGDMVGSIDTIIVSWISEHTDQCHWGDCSMASSERMK